MGLVTSDFVADLMFSLIVSSDFRVPPSFGQDLVLDDLSGGIANIGTE